MLFAPFFTTGVTNNDNGNAIRKATTKLNNHLLTKSEGNPILIAVKKNDMKKDITRDINPENT